MAARKAIPRCWRACDRRPPHKAPALAQTTNKRAALESALPERGARAHSGRHNVIGAVACVPVFTILAPPLERAPPPKLNLTCANVWSPAPLHRCPWTSTPAQAACCLRCVSLLLPSLGSTPAVLHCPPRPLCFPGPLPYLPWVRNICHTRRHALPRALRTA
jgi:hypothetical protein